MYKYYSSSKALLDEIVEKNCSKIDKASKLLSECICNDKLIQTLGTGHSDVIGLELFVRAGGLANVNSFLDSSVMTSEGSRRSAEIERIEGYSKIIWDQHKIEKGDVFIIISNSGRNAMPIEIAMLAKEKGLKVIGITSIEQSKKYPSRHSSNKKLYDLADIVIDNCVPSGDGMLNIGGDKTGAASTLSGTFIVNLISTEAMLLANEKGVKLPIYYSQNIDGYSNEELYNKYENRIKHL